MNRHSEKECTYLLWFRIITNDECGIYVTRLTLEEFNSERRTKWCDLELLLRQSTRDLASKISVSDSNSHVHRKWIGKTWNDGIWDSGVHLFENRSQTAAKFFSILSILSCIVKSDEDFMTEEEEKKYGNKKIGNQSQYQNHDFIHRNLALYLVEYERCYNELLRYDSTIIADVVAS